MIFWQNLKYYYASGGVMIMLLIPDSINLAGEFSEKIRISGLKKSLIDYRVQLNERSCFVNRKEIAGFDGNIKQTEASIERKIGKNARLITIEIKDGQKY